MSRYEPDSGDISLSLPPSASSRHLPSHERDITSPTPQRLYGKTLFSRNVESGPSTPRASNFPSDIEPSTPTPGPSTWPEPPRASSAAPSPSNLIARRTSRSTSINRSKSLSVKLPSTSPRSALESTPPARTPSARIGWNRQPGEARPPPLVSDTVARKMSRWVKEIVVCNFDLEKGPVVERRAVGRRWGPGEKENVYV